MLKKCLSVILSFVLFFGVFTVVPFSAFAATSGTTGDCTWTLDGTELTISGNGAMENYHAYYYSSTITPWGTSITKVTISDGVTSIGSLAFFECSNLTTVTIPDSVTTIGDYAFSYCLNLQNVYIGNSVESIGERAFYRCHNLKNTYIGNSIIDIGAESFADCTCLSDVAIPDSVTMIGESAFAGCTGLTEFDIPSSITDISYRLLYGCTNIKSISIPNTVTSIGESAFDNCTNLTSVLIPDSVISIGAYAFNKCKSLKKITLPRSIKTIGEAAIGFYNENDKYIYFGKYDLTIYGYKNSSGESYANSFGFTFKEIVSKYDEDTGIIIDVEKDIDPRINPLSGQEAEDAAKDLPQDYTALSVYNISLRQYGFPVEPNNIVTVMMPSDKITNKVYRLETDGTLTEIKYNYKDGYMAFQTDCLGVYILAEPKESAVCFGDADGNGKIESVDATLIQRYVADIPTPYTETQLMHGDVDGNGVLELLDATAIQYYLCHLKTQFPIGQPVT